MRTGKLTPEQAHEFLREYLRDTDHQTFIKQGFYEECGCFLKLLKNYPSELHQEIRELLRSHVKLNKA